MLRHALLLLGLTALLLVERQCLAAVEPPQVRLSSQEAVALATRWLLEGRLDEADALLGQLAAALPADPQVQFLQAQSLLARGDYARAAGKLREQLSRDPTVVRVRLELARALFLAGDYGAARYHFELALGEDLPDAARENVYRYLRHIEAKTTWLEVTVSAGRDSNPGSATSARTIQILGQSFLVDDGTRAQPAWGLAANVQARKAIGAGERMFVATLLQLRDYEGRYADYHYLEATAGARAGELQSWTFAAGPLLAYYQDQPLYRGALLEVTHQAPLARRWLGVQSVGLRRLDYWNYDYLTATEGVLRLQLRYALDGASQVAFGVALTRSDARENAYSYDAQDWSVGYVRELPRRVNLEARIGLGRADYDAQWALFGEARRDRLVRADITVVARDWTWHGLAPMVSAGLARTQSTIEVVEYERSYLSFGFTRTF